MGCVDGYRLVIQLGFVNGTLRPTGVKKIYEKCPVDLGPIIAIIFLVLILIVAFVLSTMILVTICTSFTLKKHFVNHYFISFCAIVMADTVINLLMSICYVAVRQWKFGHTACYFNSFTMNILSIQMALGLMLLVIDRILVAMKTGTYMSLSRGVIQGFILLSWVGSFLLTGVSHSMGVHSTLPYRKRYSCSVAHPLDQFLLIPQIVLVIVMVTAILIVCVTLTLYIFHKEQKKHKKVKGNQTFKYFDQILMTPYYKNEAYSTACVAILTLGYLILWYPYSSVITLTPLMTSHWDNETTRAVMPEEEPRIEFTASIIRRMDTSSIDNVNLTNSSKSDYTNYIIPEMLHSPNHEIAFIWMRYIYDLFIPVVILISLKDIRAKCKALIFACRPNTVNSSSPKRISPPYLNASVRGLMTKDKKTKEENMVNFKTPVLFATSEGLHIRTVEDIYQEMQESRPLILGFSKTSTVEPNFNYDLCDVTLEDTADLEAYLHLDDDHDFVNNPLNVEKSYANPVVEKAHRVAAGRNIGDHGCSSYFLSSAISRSKLPPTPPKPRSTESPHDSLTEEMSPIDLELEPSRKGKLVRFDTNLNKEIPRRNSEVESALELSISSKVSTGSGHMADIEEVFSKPHNVKRLPLSKSNRRPGFPGSKRENSENGIISNKIDQSKELSTRKVNRSKPLKNGLPERTNKLTGVNIKSRYVNNTNIKNQY